MFVGYAQQHHFLWGSVHLQSKGNGINLQIILRPTETDTVAVATRTFYYAVAPKTNIRLQLQRHITHALLGRNIQYLSSLEQIRQHIPKTGSSFVNLTGYRWFRGKRFAVLSVASLIQNGSAIQTVDTIDIAISGVTASATSASSKDKYFQSVLQELDANSETATSETEALSWVDSTKIWIPLNGKTIKMTIPCDGVYRLTYAQLMSLVPELTSVDPSTFQLFNKGLELPMTVKSETNGIFSSGDYLEFVGLKNYNPDTLYRTVTAGQEEYPEYMNRYTDTSYYWLVWGNSTGVRYTTNDTNISSTDSLQWYTETVHIEKNTVYAYCGSDELEQQNPYWTSADIWGWGYIYAGGRLDPTFTATQLQSNAFSPRIYMKIAGSASGSSAANAHLLQIGINSTLLPDTTALGPFEQKVLRRTVDISKLNEGNNTLHFFSYPTTSLTNSVLFDWAEVEYPRSLKVTNDSLWFGFRDVGSTAVRKVILTGLTSNNLVVYKIGIHAKRIVGTISGTGSYTLSFVDSVCNGDRYVLVTTDHSVTPVLAYKNSFAGLRNPLRRADYLLITDSIFYNTAVSYASFIQSTYGLLTAIINIKDIYDEFGYGYPVPEAEREFLKATTNWNAPMPSYVLLVGEANYDFKNYIGVPAETYVRNIVPVYGMPVTDQWIAKLDDSLDVPQMYVGRLTAATVEEFQRYFTRLETYVHQSFDVWNKRYLFFAGGSSSSENSTFHTVNQSIMDNIVKPRPIGGIAIDFYKTVNPVSSFGPYTVTQISNAIDSSAVMITYIGHSGTETWDNDINSVTDLANNVGRYPLISDFGCSTAKFAEPNIRSFSEQFVVGTNGSAIGYIGNSSLGFVSIATSLPEHFFEKVMSDSTHTIGKDHLLGKLLTLSQNGWTNTSMGRQLMLTNTLIGDPAVRLPIPALPNLVISSSLISSLPGIPSDDNDAVSLAIPYHNLGSVPTDTFKVKVTHTYLTTNSDTILSLPIPLYADTIHLSYIVRNLPGKHTFAIQLNPAHTVSESNYSDNFCEYSIVVQTAVYRIAYPVPELNCPSKKFVLLNPVKKTSDANTVTIMIDTSESFLTASSYTAPLGQVVTSFVPIDTVVKRYYWKTSGNSTTASGSFIPSSDSLTRWTQSTSSEWTANSYQYTEHTSKGVSLIDSTYAIEIVSSGWNTSRYGAVKVNDNNLIGTTFSRGITVVQLDTMDFHVIQQKSFDTHADTMNAASLAAYLNAMIDRSLVAMVVIDEAQSFLTESACTAIKKFGSRYIDHIRAGEGYRAAWALFGRKGSAIGESLESWHPAADSLRAILDTTITNISFNGYVLSPSFGPASQWTTVNITKNTPSGSTLGMYVLGTTLTGTLDTLVKNDTSSTIDLTSFSAKKYRSLRLLGKFMVNTSGETPILKDWEVVLKSPPELAINYQCVSITADTLLEGKSLGISSKIFNAGEQPVDSVKVVFTLMNSGIRQKDTVLVPVVPADSFATINYSLMTAGRAGSNTEIISIDPDQTIPEIYTVNNYYSFSFYVQSDTTKPTFDITFDGRRIYDGDYILPHPTIRIAIYDNSPLPIQNPSFVNLTLDDRRITLGEYPDSLFETKSGPEKAVVTFKPALSGKKDAYKLMLQVKDSTGNEVDLGNPIYFVVDSVWEIRNVFNYPNPFASETYFTFLLTNYADEVEIKIYTISGRLIQDILVPPQSENAYYQVYWNGRDRDGDEIANGVYFYKIIAKSNGLTRELIQKLAKIR
ncbi:MAG: C25 family cysteine peptidase [Ignavibacteriales bacterium]|nr:C25 family cysteine peptidase [Ignavibacteriales bacterium]